MPLPSQAWDLFCWLWEAGGGIGTVSGMCMRDVCKPCVWCVHSVCATCCGSVWGCGGACVCVCVRVHPVLHTSEQPSLLRMLEVALGKF